MVVTSAALLGWLCWTQTVYYYQYRNTENILQNITHYWKDCLAVVYVFSTELKLSKSFFSASDPIHPSHIMPQFMRALATKGKILSYCSFGWEQRWQESLKSHRNSTVCSRLFLVHWPTICTTPLKSTAHILTPNWLFFLTRETANPLHIKIYGLRNLWAVTAESLCRNVPLISKWRLLCFIKMLCSLHKQCEESV